MCLEPGATGVGQSLQGACAWPRGRPGAGAGGVPGSQGRLRGAWRGAYVSLPPTWGVSVHAGFLSTCVTFLLVDGGSHWCSCTKFLKSPVTTLLLFLHRVPLDYFLDMLI